MGIEPTTVRITAGCSCQPSSSLHEDSKNVAGTAGLQPATPRLEAECSRATELCPRSPGPQWHDAAEWLDEESNSNLPGFNRALSPRLSYPTAGRGVRSQTGPAISQGSHAAETLHPEMEPAGLEPATSALQHVPRHILEEQVRTGTKRGALPIALRSRSIRRVDPQAW